MERRLGREGKKRNLTHFIEEEEANFLNNLRLDTKGRKKEGGFIIRYHSDGEEKGIVLSSLNRGGKRKKRGERAMPLEEREVQHPSGHTTCKKRRRKEELARNSRACLRGVAMDERGGKKRKGGGKGGKCLLFTLWKSRSNWRDIFVGPLGEICKKKGDCAATTADEKPRHNII